MKAMLLKTAMMAVIATASTAWANAEHNPTLYVQVDLGSSHLTAKTDNQTLKGDGLGYRVAIGKQVKPNLRLAVDYLGADGIELENKLVLDCVSNTCIRPYERRVYHIKRTDKLSAQSLGVSGYYDFVNDSRFTPYVGARLAVNRLQIDVEANVRSGILSDTAGREAKNHTFGGGAMLGVQYRYSDTTKINLNGEYNHFGKISEWDAKVSNAGASIGLRFDY